MRVVTPVLVASLRHRARQHWRVILALALVASFCPGVVIEGFPKRRLDANWLEAWGTVWAALGAGTLLWMEFRRKRDADREHEKRYAEALSIWCEFVPDAEQHVKAVARYSNQGPQPVYGVILSNVYWFPDGRFDIRMLQPGAGDLPHLSSRLSAAVDRQGWDDATVQHALRTGPVPMSIFFTDTAGTDWVRFEFGSLGKITDKEEAFSAWGTFTSDMPTVASLNNHAS